MRWEPTSGLGASCAAAGNSGLLFLNPLGLFWMIALIPNASPAHL